MMPVSNPFITRRVRPGAIPYLFPTEQGVDHLVDRLRDCNWWGQIIAPHGHGKSTLLCTLLDYLPQRTPRRILRCDLHNQQRSLPRFFWTQLKRSTHSLIVVDGYEQLCRWERFWLQRRCRRLRHGLLVTAHKDVSLPTLYRPVVTANIAIQVVEYLTQECEVSIETQVILSQLERRGGNLRETLFDLYDLVEGRVVGTTD